MTLLEQRDLEDGGGESTEQCGFAGKGHGEEGNFREIWEMRG